MQTIYDVIEVLMKKGMDFKEAAKETEAMYGAKIPERIIDMARQEMDYKKQKLGVI